MSSHSPVQWGVIGAGNIARQVARAIRDSESSEIAAVASSREESAEEFAGEFEVDRTYTSYQALLDDEAIEAVYISLLNPGHARWTVRAAEAGKAVLCEKPAAMNQAELMVMLEACRRHETFFMEAFMWRCHPGAAKLAELIRAGELGEVRMIDAHFAFDLGGNPDHTRMKNELGGGGILDVGCYTLSAARLIAGAALDRDFAEPEQLHAVAHVGATQVDEWSAALARFEGDIVANLACGVQVNRGGGLWVYGSKANLQMPSPWFNDGRILITPHGQQTKEIVAGSDQTLYVHEVDMVARCVREGRLEAYPPAMTWDDSRGQQEALDRWRKAVGVEYATERSEALAETISGRPVKPRSDHRMRYGRISGVEKPIARAAMGTVTIDFHNMPLTCALLDDYFERGGNTFDSAHIYGPKKERALGRWHTLRGVRDQIVILGKGAHTPNSPRPHDDPGCDPETLTRELHESLDRLETDYLDIYCMHRDNPKVPAGEFIDVLHEHAEAGRIHVFGGSNWTIERFEQANEYAQKNGKRKMSVISNNISLAKWNRPMWTGCISASDPESLAWLKKTHTPIFAWSSQASGFFTGRFSPEDADNPRIKPVVDSWFNEQNFQRLERTKQLAERHGVSPLQIALAYVLCLDAEIFALIGPAHVDETRTSLEALDVQLDPGEMAWINLETDNRPF